MKRFLMVLVVLAILCVIPTAVASVLNIPTDVKIIESEAFRGDLSLDEVVLPDGIERIEEGAFANSSLRKINLPSSLTMVADNAFDGVNYDFIEIQPTGGGHDWAVRKRLRAPHGNTTDSFFYHNGSSEKLFTNTIIEHDLNDGAFQFTCDITGVRLLNQMLSEGVSEVQLFGYSLNEYPDANDETQINRSVGQCFYDLKYDIQVFLRLALQAEVNDDGFISISEEQLKRGEYCVIHIGFCEDGNKTPSSWGSYFIHGTEVSMAGD